MKRFIVILFALAIGSGCLPTREQFPFESGGPDENNSNNMVDMGDNNVTPDGGDNNADPDMSPNNVTDMNPNNVTPDMNPNNVTPDMGTNNTTPDMGTNNMTPDMCMPESNTEFCDRNAAACESFTGMDNCGDMRTVNCGTCPNNELCTNNVCEGCVPEDDATFCARLGAECGLLMAEDNCRMTRNINCGGCDTAGTGCNQQNTCVEFVCDDELDNDNSGETDCADSACLNRSCGPGNRRCQADGTCQN